MPRPILIVHGGAGTIPEERHAAAVEGCRWAAQAGWSILEAGGSALDAVEAAVRTLEEDPTFNAGRGSVRTRAGTVEMDALIMEGTTLRAGGRGGRPSGLPPHRPGPGGDGAHPPCPPRGPGG
jgi:beta-aspartyl-peptidase (threonine type)